MAKGTIGLGQFHGKMGGMVMRVVNGKQVMQMYQPTVTNPNTRAQRAQRDGIKVLGKIGGAGKEVLKNTYSGRYPMAQFIGRAIKRTTNALEYVGSGQYQEPNPNWAGMPWGKGDGDTRMTVSPATFAENQTHLHVKIKGGVVSGMAENQMQKVIIAYCPDLNDVVWNISTLPSTDGGETPVPETWDGMEAHVYVVGKGYLETPGSEAIDQEAKRLPFVTTQAHYVGMIEIS